MELWAVLALLVVVIGALAAAYVMGRSSNKEEKVLAESMLKQSELNRSIERATWVDERKRLESVVAALKALITKTEVANETSATPDNVRDDLNQLFPVLPKPKT